jgi:diguanylate cyclase (GGDEF)-like protein
MVMVPVEHLDVGRIPTPLLVVSGADVVAASPAAVALLGMLVTDLAGRPVAELFDARSQGEVTNLVARGEGTGTAWTAVAPSRPLELAVGSESDGRRTVALRDLTDERRALGIIDAVADSTLVVDSRGRRLWPTGDPSSTEPLVDHMHPDDLPGVLEAFSGLRGAPDERVDRVVRSRADTDEDWQLVQIVGTSRLDDPEVGGVVVQVRRLRPGSQLSTDDPGSGRLLAFAESSPVGVVVVNRERQLVYSSPAARRLLHLEPGAGAADWLARLTPSSRGPVDRALTAALAGRHSGTFVAMCVLPDGSRRAMRTRLAPHLSAGSAPGAEALGAVVAFEDVTDEIAARAESERLLQMLDATSDFVAIFRPSGEILHMNAALAQVLESHREGGGSGRLGELIADRDEFIQRGLDAVADADTWHGELMIQVTPERSIPVSALGVVGRDEDGELDWVAMVARDISQLKEAEERLRRMATTDTLTGLANRALFTEQLEELVSRGIQSGRGLAVLFCDLDRFKEVNDLFGHAGGDLVLGEIAERLRGIIRGGDLAARVGGDEFVILCDGATDAESLAALAERVIEAVHRPIRVDGGSVRVGISIGVAVSHGPGPTGDRILTSADQAMYRAKATGGNRYRVVEVT